MKGVIAATNLCFAEKTIYTSEVVCSSESESINFYPAWYGGFNTPIYIPLDTEKINIQM